MLNLKSNYTMNCYKKIIVVLSLFKKTKYSERQIFQRIKLTNLSPQRNVVIPNDFFQRLFIVHA